MPALHFTISGDNADLLRKVREAAKAIQDSGKTAEQTSQQIKSAVEGSAQSVDTLTKAFMKLGGIAAIGGFVRQMFKIRAEFQDTEKSMQVFLGSAEKASKFMKELQDYAWYNMFEFADLTKESAKLLAFGNDVNTVIPILDKLSNIAAGTKRPLEDLVDLYNRAKNLGSVNANDFASWAKSGVVLNDVLKDMGVEVEKNAIKFEHLEMALNKVTSEGGMFHGLMASQMDNLSASVGQLQDNFAIMLNEIGTKAQGVLKGAVDSAAWLVNNYEKLGKVIVALIATYGAYRAALAINNKLVTLKNTLAVYDIATKKVQIGLTLKQITAQVALNKVIMANPYVLLATAVIGLGAAIWTLRDKTTAAEKAQADYNKRKKEAAEKEREHKQKIDELLSSVTDLILAECERNDALSKLREKYKDIFADYDLETIKLADILRLKQLINEADAKRNREKKAKDLDDLDNEINKYENAINSPGKRILTNLLNFNASAPTKTTKIIEEKIEYLIAQKDAILEDIGKQVSEQFILTFKDADISKLDEHIENLKKEIEGKGYDAKIKLSLPVEIEGKYWDNELYSVKDLQNIIEAAESVKNKREEAEKNKTTYAKELAKALEELTAAEKELRKIENSDTTTPQDRTAAVERHKKAKEDYDKLKKTFDDKQQDDSKQTEERINQELMRLRKENEQARIEQEAEEGKRVRKQIQFNYDNQIADIKKREEEWKAAQKGKLTDEQEAEIKEAKEVAKITKDTAEDDQTKKEAEALDYLIGKYKDHAAQRLAIEEKYNADIEALQAQRITAIKAGNSELVNKIERSIAQATKERGTEMMTVDFNILKESPEYVRAFEDLKNTSTKTLTALIEQLEEAKIKAAEILDPTDLREYTSTIESIMNELNSRDIFGALTRSQENNRKAQANLAAATRNLNAAYKSGNVDKIAAATKKYNAALDDAAKASNDYKKASEEVSKQILNLCSAISGLGSAIGGQAGEIIKLIGDVGTFVVTSIEGMKTAAAAGTAAMKAVESASVILTIISTAIMLFQKLKSLFGKSDDDGTLEKEKQVNKLRHAVNMYEIAVLKAKQAEESWFGNDPLGDLRRSWDLAREAMKNYTDLLKEKGWLFDDPRMKGRGGEQNIGLTIETRSEKKRKGKNNNSQQTQNLITWARENGFGELFDENGMIDVDAAKRIIDEYGDKLQGNTQQILEEMIEYAELYQEYLDQLRDYVSSLYSPLVDNMVDAIWEWFDTGRDALDSFKDFASQTFRNIASDMMKNMLMTKIFDGLKDDLTDAYDDFNAGRMTAEQLAERISGLMGGATEAFENEIPSMQNFLETFNDLLRQFGFDMQQDGGSSNSLSGAYAKASQESIDLLAGQTGALRVAVEDIRDIVKKLDVGENFKFYPIIQETIGTIRDLQINGWREVTAIRELTAQVNENTSKLNQISLAISDSNSSIKTNTSHVSDLMRDISANGLKIKMEGL